MDRRYEVGMTPDNTKVMKLMGDFYDFMDHAKEDSMRQSSSISAIPFHLPSEDDDNQSTVMQNVRNKVKLKQLEAIHSSNEKSLTKRNIALETKIAELESMNLQLKERCSNYEARVQELTQQAIDFHDQLKEAQDSKLTEVSKWEQSAADVHKLKLENEQKLTHQLELFRSENNELAEQNRELENNEKMMEIKFAEIYSQLEHYKSQAQTGLEIQTEYEENKIKLMQAEHEIMQISSRLDDAHNAENMAAMLKKDMNRLRLLEIESRRLSDENSTLKLNQENCALLEERLLSVQTKVYRLEERCEQIPKLMFENERLVAKLSEMKAQTEQEASSNTHHVQTSGFEAYMNKLEEEVKTLKEQLSNSESKTLTDRKSAVELEMKLSEQQEVVSSLKAQLIRLKKRAALFAYERDSIRALLQTYDAELTMTSHTTQLNKRLGNMSDANKKLHEKIDELEAEIQKHSKERIRHKLQMKQLELGMTREKPVETPPQVVTDNSEEMSALKEKITTYEAERAEMVEKISNLEAWIDNGRIKGDYNPDTTKVLHFAMNPADLAHQQSKRDLAELKEQNSKLQLKLQQLEQGHDVSMSEVEFSKKAKSMLNAAELRNQRLKEIFSKKIQEFRQACYSLTGFRIDCSSDSKFKLLSMYADSEADCLEFEVKSNGEIQLLETEYSATLTELISLHLHHQNSIPMFLCALTVNLFGQQTMMAD